MKKKIVIAGLVVLLACVIINILYVQITGLLSFTGVDTCSDTDFGTEYDTQGMIQGKFYAGSSLEGILYQYEDTCLSQNILLEYSCSRQGIHSYKSSIKYECKYGCEAGRCNPSTEGIEKPAPAIVCNLWCELKRALEIL